MKSKYGAVKTDGYASKKEARRAYELRLLQRAGKISELREQVPFVVIPAIRIDGKLIEREARYIADFVYVENGKTVVEDCKGFRTPEYRLKKKLMLERYGIQIRET